MTKDMKFIIEHMEPEIEDWVRIEYEHILHWVGKGNLILSHVDANLIKDLPPSIARDAVCTTETVQTLDIDQSKVLLLDPSAPQALSPEDGEHFDYLLFGGILVLLIMSQYH